MSTRGSQHQSDDHEAPLFAADAMLGRLAKKLRMLGYDVFYSAGIEDRELKRIALRERRVLLTRDHEIAETSLPVRVVLMESDDVAEQLSQVNRAFGLELGSASFTRCTECNVPVEIVDKLEIEDAVPPYVYATQDHFGRCPACGRIYWEATHVEHARQWLDDALDHGGTPAERGRALDPGARPGNVLVTGRPGVGKTTLLRRVLSGLDVEAGGFYTSEIRAGDKRVGFSIVSLSGERGVLAHVDHRGPYRVGRYGVNRDDLERIGVAALDRAVRESELIVMDEIGRMELCSPSFQEAVLRALDSARPVLGTIQQRRNAFLDAVRARADVEIVEVTEANRDGLVPELSSRVRELVSL